jgi:hypothetical protein
MVETVETGKRFGMPAKQLVQAIYKKIRNIWPLAGNL